ncbi:MAG TPA: hypothetical protein PKB06_01210 [Actinotalea sp.]|nr:hypothetical protein [Actinotalea sp.]
MTTTDLMRGAVHGAIAAMTMTGFRSLATRAGPLDRTPPEAMVEEQAPDVVSELPQDKREAVAAIAHWAYGAAGGVVHALLPTALTRNRWWGPAYGTVLWLGYEVGLAPLLDLHDPKTRTNGERAMIAVDHVLYGVVLTRLRPVLG